MSAHMEDKAHFDVLVTHGLSNKTEGRFMRPMDERPLVWSWNGEWYSLNPDNKWATYLSPDDVGQMLYDENFKSVGYRYDNDETMTGQHETYEYDPVQPLTAEQVAFACRGYIYQSCEHPEFYKSNAYAYVMALIASMADAMTPQHVSTWSISEDDVKRPLFVAIGAFIQVIE